MLVRKCVYILFIALAACGKKIDDKTQIKNCFNKYKQASLENRGSKAVECLDKRTIIFYGNILYYAINYDSIQIVKLPVFEKLTVLTLKHTISYKVLKNIDAKILLGICIDKGHVNKAGLIKANVDSVSISENFGIAYLELSSKNNPGQYLSFYKENGEWKLNLSDFFERINPILHKQYYEEYGLQDEDIPSFLEEELGPPVNSDIWHPIIQNPTIDTNSESLRATTN